MKDAELTYEEPPIPSPRLLPKKQPSHPGKKPVLKLRDLPHELRKKEASKPLYLIRYE